MTMTATSGDPTTTSDTVDLRVPADPAYLAVLRTATAGLAARLDLTLDEIEDMLRLLAAMPAGDPRRVALRQHLVEAQLPLVHHLAQRFRGRGEPYDDLVQVGTIGLLNAVDRFDPERGSFTGFAVPTIL